MSRMLETDATDAGFRILAFALVAVFITRRIGAFIFEMLTSTIAWFSTFSQASLICRIDNHNVLYATHFFY